jgi:Mn2+/Fe2+ NRAMP family transporter
MIAIQLVSAHIGRVTGKGIAANAKQFYPLSFVLVPVFLLAVANTINIAADLAAMGEALYLVIGGLKHEHALIFAAMSVLLQVFVPYRRYAPILKFLTRSARSRAIPSSRSGEPKRPNTSRLYHPRRSRSLHLRRRLNLR